MESKESCRDKLCSLHNKAPIIYSIHAKVENPQEIFYKEKGNHIIAFLRNISNSEFRMSAESLKGIEDEI